MWQLRPGATAVDKDGGKAKTRSELFSYVFVYAQKGPKAGPKRAERAQENTEKSTKKTGSSLNPRNLGQGKWAVPRASAGKMPRNGPRNRALPMTATI
jgi:hypothetical protein